MARKLSEPDFQKLLSSLKTSIDDLGLTVNEVRAIQYGVQLVLLGGGLVSVYNGKSGPSGVLGGRFTNEERGGLEVILTRMGLLRGGTVAVPTMPTSNEPPVEFPDFGKDSYNLTGVAGARIGTDESGKGDYFGPLVVAGVLIEPSQTPTLVQAGVQDSKLISSHTTAMTIGGWIEATFPCAVQSLMPEDYNRQYGGNLNVLLARLHAKVIAELAASGKAKVALIDKFTTTAALQREVRALNCSIRVMALPRAEADIAVAAASIVARSRYLQGLRELSNEWTVKLGAGAGDPVLRAGAEMVRLYGPDSLGKVGKLHFKTTEQILAYRPTRRE